MVSCIQSLNGTIKNKTKQTFSCTILYTKKKKKIKNTKIISFNFVENLFHKHPSHTRIDDYYSESQKKIPNFLFVHSLWSIPTNFWPFFSLLLIFFDSIFFPLIFPILLMIQLSLFFFHFCFIFFGGNWFFFFGFSVFFSLSHQILSLFKQEYNLHSLIHANTMFSTIIKFISRQQHLLFFRSNSHPISY